MVSLISADSLETEKHIQLSASLVAGRSNWPVGDRVTSHTIDVTSPEPRLFSVVPQFYAIVTTLVYLAVFFCQMSKVAK